jgi:hypothetical protein
VRQPAMFEAYRRGLTCRRVFTTSRGVTAVWVGPQAAQNCQSLHSRFVIVLRGDAVPNVPMMPPRVHAAKYVPEKSSIFLCVPGIGLSPTAFDDAMSSSWLSFPPGKRRCIMADGFARGAQSSSNSRRPAAGWWRGTCGRGANARQRPIEHDWRAARAQRRQDEERGAGELCNRAEWDVYDFSSEAW